MQLNPVSATDNEVCFSRHTRLWQVCEIDLPVVVLNFEVNLVAAGHLLSTDEIDDSWCH